MPPTSVGRAVGWIEILYTHFYSISYSLFKTNKDRQTDKKTFDDLRRMRKNEVVLPDSSGIFQSLMEEVMNRRVQCLCRQSDYIDQGSLQLPAHLLQLLAYSDMLELVAKPLEVGVLRQ